MKEKLALAVIAAALSTTAWAAGGTASGAAEEQPSQSLESGAMSQQGHEQAQQEPAQKHEQMQQARKTTDLNEDEIRQLQEALKEAGHDPGQVDGVMGPETEQALREFEQAQGLESTGELNDETLSTLGLDSLRKGQAEFAGMEEEQPMEQKSGSEHEMPLLEEESGSSETPPQ